jgi:predicted Zn-dependent protease
MKKLPFICIGVGALAAAIGVGCTFMQNVGHSIGGPVEGFINGMSEAHDARRLGPGDEDELGKSVAILVTNKYPPSTDQDLVRYVNLVGYTLVSCSRKPDGYYAFGVLDTDDIDAYSGPNGYVMITRGAVASMSDEAQLAGVLAHELTHVIDQHGLESARVAAEKAGYMDAAKSLLHSADATRFIDSGIDAVVRNGYDKPQETAADAGAVDLLIATGYDPRSYANYLAHLAALQQAAPQGGQAATAMNKIMSTHPDIPDRYQAVLKLIAAHGGAGGATLGDRFRTMTKELHVAS